MKGVIFNILEDFVLETWGEDELEAIFNSTKLSTQDPFVGPMLYPDEDLLRLVETICIRNKMEPATALTQFGVFAFPKLKAACPASLDHIKSAPALLSILDRVIHVEVKKLTPLAMPPDFRFVPLDEASEGHYLSYSSSRGLCAFVEGMLYGVGKAYQSKVELHKIRCMADGHKSCDYKIFFSDQEEK